LPSDSIRAVFEDCEGSLWIGGVGLGQIKDGTVLSYGRAQGLADEDVYAVTTARRKGLWVGTSAGEVALFARGRFAPVAGRAVLHGATVLALREDRAGRLWVGTDHGLHSLSGRALDDLQRPRRPAPDDIRSILDSRRPRARPRTLAP